MTGAEIRAFDRETLGHIASIYYRHHQESGDHRTAFVSTCREAILEGYRPAACWTSSKMLAERRPTHVVAFQHEKSPAYIFVLVGGVSIDSVLDIMYDPATGHPGWMLIDGEALAVYQTWARASAA